MVADLCLFLWTIVGGSIGLAGGAFVTVALGIAKAKYNWDIDWKWYRRLIAVALLISVFAAWRDEHRRAEKLEPARRELSSDEAIKLSTQARAFDGPHKLDVWVPIGDSEAFTYARQIVRTLEKVEWAANGPIQTADFPDVIGLAIFTGPTASKQAERIQAMMKEGGLVAPFINHPDYSSSDPSEFVVYVGRHP